MPYELLEEDSHPESTLGYAGRTLGRTAARAGEAIAGLPGDIASIPLALGNYAAKKITGKEDFFGKRANIADFSAADRVVHALTGKNLPFKKIDLPTSQDIRENITKPLTGESLEPQGSGEALWDDIVGDAATMLLPIGGNLPFARTAKGIGAHALKAFGRSAAGNIAKIATETVTGSPLLGAGAKIGAMALASTFGGRKVMTQAKEDLYKQAYSHIPPDKQFHVIPEKSKLNSIHNALKSGDKPDKSFLLERIEAFNNIVKQGKIDPKKLINLKQDWNDQLRNVNLSPQAEKIFIDMRDTLKKGISRYGKNNTKFSEFYKPAEELTAALNGTNYVQKFLSSNPYLKDSVKNPLIKKFLGGSGTLGLLYGGHKLVGTATTAGLAGGALGVREGARLYQLLSRSPYALKYYKDVASAALKNDLKALPKALEGLDKAANEFDKEEPQFEEVPEEGRFELVG